MVRTLGDLGERKPRPKEIRKRRSRGVRCFLCGSELGKHVGRRSIVDYDPETEQRRSRCATPCNDLAWRMPLHFPDAVDNSD